MFFYDPQNRLHGPAGSEISYSTGRRYATEAMTWSNGPHRSPDDVITWAAGECKSIPIGDWLQNDQTYDRELCPDQDEWGPCLWSEPVPVPLARVRPGDYVVRAHWGGIEAGGERRQVIAESATFSIAGVSLRIEFDGVTARSDGHEWMRGPIMRFRGSALSWGTSR